MIRIERTKYFQPKSEESAASVDLAAELVEIFRAFHSSVAEREFS